MHAKLDCFVDGAQRRRALLFVVFAATCVLATVVTRGYLMDDALITMRYARHFAEHGRATWNSPGTEPPRIGYTSVAWMAMEASLALVVSDPDALIVCTQTLAGLTLVVVAWLFADKLARTKASTPVCLVFGLLLFANAGHGLHVNSAMETILFCMVTLLALWSRDRGQPPLVSYAWVSLALLVRPEALLMATVLAWLDVRGGARKAALVGGGLVCATAAALFVVMIVAYDSPVPSSVSIKLGGLYPKRYSLLAVGFFVAFCAPTFVMGALFNERRDPRAATIAVAASAALLTFLVFLRPIMNDCFRYEWPALFWLAFAAASVVDVEVKRYPRTAMTVLAATLLVNARTSMAALDAARWRGRLFGRLDRHIGRALAGIMGRGDWLVVTDAGTLPYFADVPTIDALGLADGAGTPHERLEGIYCKPQVSVVVVDGNDPNLTRTLGECGFSQHVDVTALHCGERVYSTSLYARDRVRLDRAALVDGFAPAEQCGSMLWNGDLDLSRASTWLWWDGTW